MSNISHREAGGRRSSSMIWVFCSAPECRGGVGRRRGAQLEDRGGAGNWRGRGGGGTAALECQGEERHATASLTAQWRGQAQGARRWSAKARSGRPQQAPRLRGVGKP